MAQILVPPYDGWEIGSGSIVTGEARLDKRTSVVNDNSWAKERDDYVSECLTSCRRRERGGKGGDTTYVLAEKMDKHYIDMRALVGHHLGGPPPPPPHVNVRGSDLPGKHQQQDLRKIRVPQR
jgi:hypothetical protein